MRDVTQIMPAPGWRVVYCYEDVHGAVQFQDMPVVGWGVVHIHDEKGVDDHNMIELIIFDEEGDWSEPVSDYFKIIDDAIVHHVLPPNQELTDELKQQWSDELRRQLKSERIRSKYYSQRKSA